MNVHKYKVNKKGNMIRVGKYSGIKQYKWLIIKSNEKVIDE